MAWLLFAGAACVLLIFPFCSDVQRLNLKKSWSASLVRALGIKIEADMTHVVPGALIVANHISWVDIFVINAVVPCAFVAKKEIQDWPLIGWLSANNDTFFLRRGSWCHARGINQKLSDVLRRKKNIVVFPEGTTTDGRHVLPFHTALFQSALDAGQPIVPLSLSYWESNGHRSLAPRYDGGVSFWECSLAIMCRRRLTARLIATKPLGLKAESRRLIATQARKAIALAAGLVLSEDHPSGITGPDHTAETT